MTDDTKASPSKYTCNERREEMILLGMRQQLQRTDLTEEERAKLIAKIAKLEKELGF